MHEPAPITVSASVPPLRRLAESLAERFGEDQGGVVVEGAAKPSVRKTTLADLAREAAKPKPSTARATEVAESIAPAPYVSPTRTLAEALNRLRL